MQGMSVKGNPVEKHIHVQAETCSASIEDQYELLEAS